MLSCMVDGQTHDVMSCEGGMLGDIFESLSSELSKNGRLIASFKVNGEEIEERSERCAGWPLTTVSRIEVTSESTKNPAWEVLAEGCDFLVELRLFLLHAAKLYRSGDEAKGSEVFMELIQGLEWFVKITSAVGLMLKIDFSVTSCAGRTIAESVDSLNRILLEIILAQEQRDLVLLTDLLEYELAPQLVLWLEIFTELRGMEADNIGESA